MQFTRKRPLRIGTDCSGIEAPIFALRELKIPFVHEFSSEIDKHCISTIRANCSPRIIFGDMRERKLKNIPDIDLYLCGFPCQPFSTAGKREGVQDPRGTIFWECLRVIRYKKPIIFVLENVRGLLSIDKGSTFQTILSELKNLRTYHIYWKVLNTADYGIPQSRKRVFIVGIQKMHQKKEFEWPRPKKCKKLEDFVDEADNRYEKLPNYFYSSNMDQLVNPKSIFIDMGYRKFKHDNADIICPCLTLNLFNFYCLKKQRHMNVKEALSLQGFPVNIKIVVSKCQIFKQIGNSMSVNVLVALFKNIYYTLE